MIWYSTTFLFICLCAAFLLVQEASGWCKLSDVPSGVTIVGPCGFQAEESCKVVCQEGKSLHWEDRSRCHKNGTWSSLPPCTKGKKVTSVDVMKCTKVQTGQFEGKATCVKIRIAIPVVSEKKMFCPEVLDTLVRSGDCVRTGVCAVACGGQRSFALLCIGAGADPSCSHVQCPPIKFARLAANCSRELFSSCKVECPNGAIAKEEAVCQPTGEWVPLPSCRSRDQCAKQIFPPEIRFVDDNCQLSDSKQCQVGCFNPENHTMGLVKNVTCTSDGTWKGLPHCSKITVNSTKPKPDEHREDSENSSIGTQCPSLPPTFQFIGTCDRSMGTICSVKCTNGTMKGKSVIVCNPSGKWSKFPRCVLRCPEKASEDLSFADDCSFEDGRSCQVKCREQDHALVGLNFMRCHRGLWKNIPLCYHESKSPYRHLKVTCEPPNLFGNLMVKGSCKLKGGMSCDIKCRDENAILTGPNSITCLPPGLWSKVKPCVGGNIYCDRPTLPKYIEMVNDCTGIAASTECQVYCRNDPSVRFSITCKGGKKWTPLKICYCIKPNLTDGMTGNCKKVPPGKFCSVNCTIGYSMTGKSSVPCTEMLQWGEFPSCVRMTCQKPDLDSALLVFREDCSGAKSGRECQLECRNGGTIRPRNKIKCISGSQWTALPNCTCPEPILADNLITEGDCKNKYRGENCVLTCEKNYTFQGKKFIRCGGNGLWERTLSTCIKRTCVKPKLPTAILPAENCESKEIGQNCSLECKFGGTILGSKQIRCLNYSHWSPNPECACPPPDLPQYIQAKGNCSVKRSGEECELECKNHMKLEGNKRIRCQDTAQWTRVPMCEVRFCPKVKLPPILSYAEDCSRVAPTKKCNLMCTEGGKLIGSDSIVCIDGNKWSIFPKCTCPTPDLPDNLLTKVDCSQIEVGGLCDLECAESFTLAGKSSIVCEFDTRWSSPPRCLENLCPIPILRAQLHFLEPCVGKSEEEHCRLECRGNRHIVGPSTIACKKGKSKSGLDWGELPSCTCPPPVLPQAFRTSEDCDSKKSFENCGVECLNPHHRFTGEGFVTCEADSNWSKLKAKCEKMVCKSLALPNILMKEEDCSAKEIGEECEVSCRSGGSMIGSPKIKCLENLDWSVELPKCTCPEPSLPGYLEMVGNCSSVMPGEVCNLRCKEENQSVMSIKCQKDTYWEEDPVC